MSDARSEELALDDRALDDDIERLRASTEHYIDIVRAWVRRTLADGEHPEDAMVRAAELINDWLQGRGVPFYTPLQETADTINGFIVRVRGVMSARDTIVWFLAPACELRGRTPIQALVSHRFHELEAFIRKAEDAKRYAEAAGENEQDLGEPEGPDSGGTEAPEDEGGGAAGPADEPQPAPTEDQDDHEEGTGDDERA